MVIFPRAGAFATIALIRGISMKNLFLTLVFALALVPACMAKSETQLLCDNCPQSGQADTSSLIVMALVG